MTAMARIRAIDRFIKGCREDGIYDDLNACCVMAGWDSLAGALTPLKGTAPTNSGFIDADLDRGIGITGDGTSYLDSGRSSDDDPAADCHLAVFSTSPPSGTIAMYVGGQVSNPYDIYRSSADMQFRNGGTQVASGLGLSTGLIASTRNAADSFSIRVSGTTTTAASGNRTPNAVNMFVFARNNNGTADWIIDATVAFYSIGSSLGSDPATGLAALDARVSTLMEDLRVIEEAGFDRDALAYIRAVEAADGAYLETDVKVAINNLVSGLKADGLWDAIGSSCLLCGPRTLAGALVPLRGDAPTAYGFVDGDFDRLGLTGDGTSYLDSNRAANLTSDSDLHFACYLSTSISDNSSPMGLSSAANNASFLRFASTVYTWCNSPSGSAANASQVNNSGAAGFYGATRTTDLEFFCRNAGTAQTKTAGAGSLPSSNYYIFADNAASGIRQVSTSSISFYSIGAGLTGDSAGLAKLDSHVTAYVTAIGAAI